MSGVTTYQGHFTTPASGTTTVSTVGFTPYAIIFWVSGTGSAANNTWEQSIEDSIGFAAFDGTNYYNAHNAVMVKYATTGGVTPGVEQNATSCFAVYNTSGTIVLAGHVSSVSSSGFVITYGTSASGYIVHYLCIGGDCNKACIAVMTMEASATSPNTYQTVTLPNSISWTPSAVLFLSTTDASVSYANNWAVTALGAMDAAGNQNCISAVTETVTTSQVTNTYRLMSNSYCLDGSITSLTDAYLTYNAMGVGSFKVNKGGAAYGSYLANAVVYALCLYSTAANEILCGNWTSANGTTETVTTGVTTVQGALFYTDNDTAFQTNTDRMAPRKSQG